MRRKPKRFKSRRSWFRKQNRDPQKLCTPTVLASDEIFRPRSDEKPSETEDTRPAPFFFTAIGRLLKATNHDHAAEALPSILASVVFSTFTLICLGLASI